MSDELSEAEKLKYQKYLAQAKAVSDPPGTAPFRELKKGRIITPADLLLPDGPKGWRSEKIDAIFRSGIEKRVGMTAEEIRSASLDELREAAEKKPGRRLTYGARGNMLRDRTLSREDVERTLDAALK